MAKKTDKTRDETTKSGETTKVLPCSCKHEFQDAVYGSGNWLYNYGPKRAPSWQCTVCKRGR